jgi:hypothetical protein
MTAPEFAQVLISRREIESLELIEGRLRHAPGATMEWATLVTLIDAAKRAHEQAEAMPCASSGEISPSAVSPTLTGTP